MKRKTYNNMVKATKMISDKGYQWEEANQIAISCFDRVRQENNGMEVEWFINRIVNKEEHEDIPTLGKRTRIMSN